MYQNKKLIVVMPAYNAEKTLSMTHKEVLAHGIVDLVIVVDDASKDKTLEIARSLKKTIILTHKKNHGYGGNQKTCYARALEEGGDIIIMVHPDYQYTPKLIPAMAALISSGLYECVLGSRILGGYALKGGMPLWRYISNRFLTFVENVFTGAKLSEYHTGYRAFSRELLKTQPFHLFSNDFIFDNQMLVHILWQGYTIGEVSCPTRYFGDASSINFYRSVKYGFGCILTSLQFFFARTKLFNHPFFKH